MPRKLKLSDITALKYGRWTVLKFAAPVRSGKRMTRYVRARCECGTERVVNLPTIRNGRSRSCGCLRDDVVTKHGRSDTVLYRTCARMLRRCTAPNDESFADYGGRGIRFNFGDAATAASWIEKHLGPKPTPSHSIDRIDNDGHYEAGNIRWATKKEQQNNRRTLRTKLSQFPTQELLNELDNRSRAFLS